MQMTPHVAESAAQYDLDPATEAGRTALAKMVMQLFDLWGISTADQAVLLGLSPHSRASLARYRKGQPLEDRQDLIDRAANLLAIHRDLRILFPHNRDLVYRWPTAANEAFGGKSPVDVMREQRFMGLLGVRRYLDFQRGQ